MRAIVLIMDSFGIGAAPDAAQFGDTGASTIGHIAQFCAEGKADIGRAGPLRLPHLEQLGLGLAAQLASGELPAGFNPRPHLIGAYAAARELSSGKDTPSGHWELAGVPVRFDWGYFEKKTDSFPPELLDKLVTRAHLPGYLATATPAAPPSLPSWAKNICAPASRFCIPRPIRCCRLPATKKPTASTN